MRYFIEFSYKGTNYHGWQKQPNAITVQETLENDMSIIMGEKIALVAAGRTDAGVHAKQMFAHFDCSKSCDGNLVYKLNSILPEDIAVKHIKRVNEDAHARFDAIRRTYHYKLNPNKNVFTQGLVYDYFLPLNFELMNEAGKLLLNHKNFQCFSKSHTDVKTYNCKIWKAQWEPEGDIWIFEIAADRFLRNMVRAIVGTMINIGSGKTSLTELQAILDSRSRSEAGYSVPAHGLYLTEIAYKDSIYLVDNAG